MKEEESANEKIRRDIAAEECMHVEALYSHNAPMCLEWCELHNNDEPCFSRSSGSNSNKKFVVTHMMQPTQRFVYTRTHNHDDDVEDALNGVEYLLQSALSAAALKDDDDDNDDDNNNNDFMPPLRPTAPAPASSTPVATPVATPVLAAAAVAASAALPPMPMLE